MITRKTVFILGAGASKPFGFPLGEKLRESVIKDANSIGNVPGFSQKSFRDFGRELRRSPTASVDVFLEHRPEFIEVGRYLIAQRLIQFEIESTLYETGGDWYRYLMQKMSTPILDQFLKNEVSFITFNYDRSLEHYMHNALMSLYGLSVEKASECINHFPIVHVYGRLAPLPWQAERTEDAREYKPDADIRHVNVAAKGIKIIHEEDDEESKKVFNIAHQLLREAARVVFLGFGFHPKNIERLKLKVVKGNIVGTAMRVPTVERREAIEKLQYEYHLNKQGTKTAFHKEGELSPLSPAGYDIVEFFQNFFRLSDSIN